MGSARVRTVPALLLALDLAITAGSVALSAGREAVYDTAFYSLNASVLGLAGFLILTFRPRHRMGVVLTALGIEAGLVELAEGYGYHHSWPGAQPAGWISNWASFIGIGATVILPAIFPDGRSLTPRWAPVVWTGVAGAALASVGAAFGHGLDDGYPVGQIPTPWPDRCLTWSMQPGSARSWVHYWAALPRLSCATGARTRNNGCSSSGSSTC